MTFPIRSAMALTAFALLPACAAVPPAVPPSMPQSILASSSPANGSTVAAPVEAIELRFSPPARLGEVTVTGPRGVMPMMVSAVGETGYYSIPVSSLGTGSYTVQWKALAAGQEHRGSFGFTVR